MKYIRIVIGILLAGSLIAMTACHGGGDDPNGTEHTDTTAAVETRAPVSVRFDFDKVSFEGDCHATEHLEEYLEMHLDALLEDMKAHGITLAYHNHSSELTPNEGGLIALDWLVENTSIAVELDTFWAYNAGVDPIAKMDELGSRLVAVHLKDGVRGGEGDPLGQGQAPVKAVRDYALAHHLPIVVESESLTPTGPEEVKACIEYLKYLEE